MLFERLSSQKQNVPIIRNELGLYEFNNKNARIDITCHVCNGFNLLM